MKRAQSVDAREFNTISKDLGRSSARMAQNSVGLRATQLREAARECIGLLIIIGVAVAKLGRALVALMHAAVMLAGAAAQGAVGQRAGKPAPQPSQQQRPASQFGAAVEETEPLVPESPLSPPPTHVDLAAAAAAAAAAKPSPAALVELLDPDRPRLLNRVPSGKHRAMRGPEVIIPATVSVRLGVPPCCFSTRALCCSQPPSTEHRAAASSLLFQAQNGTPPQPATPVTAQARQLPPDPSPAPAAAAPEQPANLVSGVVLRTSTALRFWLALHRSAAHQTCSCRCHTHSCPGPPNFSAAQPRQGAQLLLSGSSERRLQWRRRWLQCGKRAQSSVG